MSCWFFNANNTAPIIVGTLSNHVILALFYSFSLITEPIRTQITRHILLAAANSVQSSFATSVSMNYQPVVIEMSRQVPLCGDADDLSDVFDAEMSDEDLFPADEEGVDVQEDVYFVDDKEEDEWNKQACKK